MTRQLPWLKYVLTPLKNEMIPAETSRGQSVVTIGKAIVIVEVANGLGQHRQDLHPATYVEYMKYDYLDWAQVCS